MVAALCHPLAAALGGVHDRSVKACAHTLVPHGPLLQLLAGGLAGGLAAAATNPLDVVKTRLQVGTGAGGRVEGEALGLQSQPAGRGTT